MTHSTYQLKIPLCLILAVLLIISGCIGQIQSHGTETINSTSTPPDTPANHPGVISSDTADQLTLLTKLTGHVGRIYGLAFSSTGEILASGDTDDTIRLWDLETLEELESIPLAGSWDLYFAPDDSHLATDLGIVWDIQEGKQIFDLGGSRSRAAFSPDGEWMASTGFSTPIQLWSTITWQVESSLEGHRDRVFGMAFSNDSRLLVTSSGTGPTDVSWYEIKVWDLSSGSEIHNLTGHRGDIHAVAVSPDSSRIASACTDYTVKVWDAQSGELLHSLRHADGLFDVAFSPDGSLIASAGVDRTVRIWNADSGAQLTILRHADEVLTVAFSPDGKLIASGGYDGDVYLWGISLETE